MIDFEPTSIILVHMQAHPPSSGVNVSNSFLGLPGEIRNRIYEFYFTEDLRIELMPRSAQCCPVYSRQTTQSAELTLRKSRWPSKTRTKPENSTRTDTRWETTLSTLLLVCRQVYTETSCYHYARTTFAIGTVGALRNLLKLVAAPNLASITKLELYHRSYGEPHRAKDIKWKIKHDITWWKACQAASTQLINLQKLVITIHVIEAPLRMEFNNNLWIAPILCFRRLATSEPFSVRYDGLTEDSFFNEMLKQQADNRNIDGPWPLKDASVIVTSRWLPPGVLLQQHLADVCLEVHNLASNSIALALLGKDYVQATHEYREAVCRKFARWKWTLMMNSTDFWKESRALGYLS